MVGLSGLHRTKQPPLTRGLSAELTGGEKIRQLITFFLSLRPFGAPPLSEGGRALPCQCDKLQFEQASLMRI